MEFEPKYPSGYQVSNHAYLKYYPYGTGLESVQVDGETFPFEVLIGTDEQRSIRALTEVNADAWCGVKGLIPLLKHKNIIVFPPDKNQELKNHLLDGGYTIQTYGSSKFKKD